MTALYIALACLASAIAGAAIGLYLGRAWALECLREMYGRSRERNGWPTDGSQSWSERHKDDKGRL